MLGDIGDVKAGKPLPNNLQELIRIHLCSLSTPTSQQQKRKLQSNLPQLPLLPRTLKLPKRLRPQYLLPNPSMNQSPKSNLQQKHQQKYQHRQKRKHPPLQSHHGLSSKMIIHYPSSSQSFLKSRRMQTTTRSMESNLIPRSPSTQNSFYKNSSGPIQMT